MGWKGEGGWVGGMGYGVWGGLSADLACMVVSFSSPLMHLTQVARRSAGHLVQMQVQVQV